MPVPAAGAPAGKPSSFELRSASLSLFALQLKSADMAMLSAELGRQFDATPDVFDHEAVVIDLSTLPAGSVDLDFPELIALLRRHRLSPVAVRAGSPELMSLGRAAGLVLAPDATVSRTARTDAAEPAAAGRATHGNPAWAEAAAAAAAEAAARRAGQPPSDAARAGTTARAPNAVTGQSPATPAAGPNGERRQNWGTVIVDRPLRSGQRVYARDADLIVMAMVNSGAEVVADGNIHIYAPLRGRAMAGARGGTDARILTLCMEPELIAIAGIYRTREKPLPDDVLGAPAQVRLDGEKLLFQPLHA